MSWTPEDESRLCLLERVSPIAAMHIRIAIEQAREQHARAKMELVAFRDRQFLYSIGIDPGKIRG